MPQSLPPEAIPLFAQSLSGDADAWARLLTAHKSRMQRYAQRVLPAAIRARESPSDVVQQTLVEAVKSRKKFRGTRPTEVAPWIFGILKNQIRLALRRHGGTGRRDVGREVSMSMIGTSELPPEPGAVSSVADGPRVRAKAVLDSLPEADRELVKWRLEEDLSFAEVGRRLGVSEDAARVRHARLMAQLRLRLKEHAKSTEPLPTEGA